VDPPVLQRAVEGCCRGALAAVAAGALVLGPADFAQAEPQIIRLPASPDPEIFTAQRTMIEAWSIIQQSFVDETMNNQDWPEALQKHMINAYMYGQDKEDPDREAKAWGELDDLLKSLGDPYTHRVLPNDFAQFKVSSDGELQGVGLLLAVGDKQNVEGHLRVLAPIRGGPADRAGILPGDEVLSIDGKDTTGWNGAMASQNLRGMGGTQVHVKLARRTDQIPGEPGTPEPPVPQIVYKDVDIKREKVAISSVYHTALADPNGGPPVGYVRVTQFSNSAADDARAAVQDLESQGISRYIMDLRSNPGGLVRSGIDLVAMWLDGDKKVFNVESRDGIEQTQTTMSGKPALTHDPLVVLVNSSSASASEIVSGALHDNGRAVIMGDSNTYGKGRIQTVYPLQDGSALFVTVAQYQTPDGTVIDLKGLKPDRACRAPTSLASLPAPPLKGEGSSSGVLGSTGGPPGQPGKGDGFMPGVPLDPVTERVLLEALQKDQCIAAAEQYLDSAEGSKRGIM